MIITDALGRLAAGLSLLALASCATTPGCRWRLLLEPRLTATVDRSAEIRPSASLTARPVCVGREPAK